MPLDSLFTLIVIGGFAYAALLGIHRRREGIRHGLRRLVVVELSYLGVTLLVVQAGATPVEGILAGLLAGLILDKFIPRRKRYVRSAERRKVIERFERRTGEKYDPKKHDLGHVVPFSDGGSNTADNLKVERRRDNRAKGAKSPWWDLVGRIR